MEEKVIIAKFGKTKVAQTEKQWRYNHGQKLKFEGVDLPANYEVHFSNSKTGTAKTFIGNADGVLIPQEYFVPGKMIYAWVYVEEDGVGVTRREVRIPIDQKAMPTDQQPLPEEQTVIEQAIEALNDAVDEIPNEITTALAEAKASGLYDGTNIWWVFTQIGSGAPDHDGRILKRSLNGKDGEAPLVGDFVYGPEIRSEDYSITDLYIIEEISGIVVFLKHLDSIKGEDGFDPEIVVEEIPNGHRVSITSANGTETFDVMNGTFEVAGDLSMENYRLTELADGVDDTDAVNKAQVEQMIREGSGLFRGSFSTKASLNMAAWQSTDPTQPYYVDNNDYCVVLSDETQHYECWRYGYVVGSGWAAQYRINEAPMTAAQIAAINSGITADRLVGLEQFKNTAQPKLSGIEAGAQVNKIEAIRAVNASTGLYEELPIINKTVNIPQHGSNVWCTNAVMVSSMGSSTRFRVLTRDLQDPFINPAVGDYIFGNSVSQGDIDSLFRIESISVIFIELSLIASFSGGSVTVDDAFSTTSENPVQNKVITVAFNQAAQQLSNLGLALDDKVDKVSGKGLSTNDFTNNDKNKVDDAATESWVQQQGYLLGGDLEPYRTAAQQDTIDAAQDTAIAAIKGVHWCTYGTTTDVEIQAAIDAGKLPAVNRNNTVFLFHSWDSNSGYTFSSSYIGGSERVACKNGVWSAGDLKFPAAATSAPSDLGTAARGTSDKYARQDHVHKMPSATDVGAVASDQGAANVNKVLKVNSSGVVVPEDNRFVVTLTPTAADFSGVMDKTIAEINAAYEAGKKIVFKVLSGVNKATYADCTMQFASGSFTYPSFNGFIIDNTTNMLIFAFTSATNDGTKATYATTIYPLATGQWTGGSY